MRPPGRTQTFHASRLLSGRSVLLGTLLLAGCSAGAKLAQLQSQAATDLACPVEQVNNVGLQPYVEKVTACGKENIYVYAHSTKNWISPLPRAAFDLECAQQQLTTQVLDNRSIGITGCGEKAVYVLSQTVVVTPFGPQTQSTWVANTIGGGKKD